MAILAGFIVGERVSTEIAIRQISKRGVLVDVVPIPLYDAPIELLAPAPRHLEAGSGSLTQSRDRRRPEKITLQVLVWAKFLEIVGHECFLTDGS